MTTTPSASDLAKLFIALSEQTKGWAQTQPSTYVPTNLIGQFNILAEAADEIADIKIAKLIESSVVHTPEAFLAQIGFAAEMLKLHSDPDASETTSDAMTQLNPDTTEAQKQKPRVFIGCSVEGLRYAKIIQLQLAHSTETTIWNQGVFGLSRGTLETLVAECSNYDYAILVLTPDDTRIKRDQEGPIPRDNVIFELGLFMGALSREHVFMAVKKGTELPTDLAGITPAIFDSKEDINLVSALGPVTTMLEIAMGII